MLLGCIADDFTGATDIAGMLVRAGMRTVQTIGVPDASAVAPGFDAVVIALKSRTAPVPDAVAGSLAALEWLRGQGARRIVFKVCSTFDSTDAGNIGPVADALLDRLGADFNLVCPAFPENGRSVYQGHLFVGELLLSDSPMRDHPLTPMTDANLVRVLGRQTPRKVGLIDRRVVRAGTPAIRKRIASLRAHGVTHAIADAIDDADLFAIAAAAVDLALVTSGSGLAPGLVRNFQASGELVAHADAATLPPVDGPAAVLAGSCSAATRRQLAVMAAQHPAIAVDPLASAEPAVLAHRAVAAALPALQTGRPFVIHSSADPVQVAAVQDALGKAPAAQRVEAIHAAIARMLVERGVRRLVVAGGETSGAVVGALGVRALAIGREIDPGVPWTVSVGGGVQLALALKSGNFGGDDFFAKALAMAP